MILDPVTCTKFIAVQRSDRAPTLHWWSLPMPLAALATIAPDQLAGAYAVVHSHAGVAVVEDLAALFAACDNGRMTECTIAVFPAAITQAQLRPRLANFVADLEHLPFTIAIRPDGGGRGRSRFCFRVPGKVIAAIEHIALGRGFGGNQGQVEMAFLQGLALRPKQRADLRLVLHEGGAKVEQDFARGHRQVIWLASGRGFVCERTEIAWPDVIRSRFREDARRFPVGRVMFVGLPFFIATFWIATLLRRGRHSSVTVDAGQDAATVRE